MTRTFKGRVIKSTGSWYSVMDDAGKTINYALDDLQQSLKRVRNPERWAEKYHKNLPVIIDMMERLTKVFGKMK